MRVGGGGQLLNIPWDTLIVIINSHRAARHFYYITARIHVSVHIEDFISKQILTSGQKIYGEQCRELEAPPLGIGAHCLLNGLVTKETNPRILLKTIITNILSSNAHE